MRWVGSRSRVASCCALMGCVVASRGGSRVRLLVGPEMDGCQDHRYYYFLAGRMVYSSDDKMNTIEEEM